MHYEQNVDCALIIGGGDSLIQAVKQGIGGENGSCCTHNKSYQNIVDEDISDYIPSPNIIFLRFKADDPQALQTLQYIKSTDGIRYIPLIAVVDSGNSPLLKKAYSNFANCCFEEEEDEIALTERIAALWSFWKEIAQFPPQMIPKT